MGDDVEGDLLGEFDRRVAVADEDVAALLEQFVHARLPRARDRLVGCDDDPLDRRGIVQRLQRDDHLRGRAIGVGDDVLGAIAVDRLGVHLGHDQRHVGVHAVQRAIVDHGAAGGGGARRMDAADLRSGGEQGDVPALEIEMLDIVDLELLAAVAKVDDRRRSSALLATAAISSNGNSRSTRMFKISRPTLPVAPTTTTR